MTISVTGGGPSGRRSPRPIVPIVLCPQEYSRRDLENGGLRAFFPAGFVVKYLFSKDRKEATTADGWVNVCKQYGLFGREGEGCVIWSSDVAPFPGFAMGQEIEHFVIVGGEVWKLTEAPKMTRPVDLGDV
jgi:hypothetical protein